MPIVIRELVIRARVEETPGPGNTSSGANNNGQRMTEADIDKIIALCIEKVMAAINRKNER